jgi:hypothetical protein
MEQDRCVMVRKPDGAMVIVQTPRDPTTRLKQGDVALDEVPGDVGAMVETWAGGVWQEEATSLRRRILKMKNIYCKVNSTSSARDSTN